MTAAAFEKPLFSYSLPATADYSAKQYYAMTIASDKLVLASAAGQKVMGILQDEPEANRHGTIMLKGITKAIFGGTVAELDPLTVDANGALVKRTDNSTFFVGWALQAAVASDIKAVYLPGVGPSGDDLTEGAIQYAEISVTSAELLALNATPKTLVAAQGAGYVTEFLSMVLILDYNSAAYANNGILGVYETDASGTVLSDTVAQADFLGKTADTIVCVQALSADTALTANKALVLTQATGESITGDSPVRVKIAYRVHKTDL